MKTISQLLNQKRTFYFLVGVLTVLAILVWSAVVQAPSPDRLAIVFLDVGQGDAIYIREPTGRDILVDGGGNDRVLDELGEVMPFWDREIDLVIATHNHADHLRGLIEVLDHFKVDEIWLSGALHTTDTYLKWLETVKKEQTVGAQVKQVRAGHDQFVGQLRLTVLFPINDLVGQQPDDQHDATIVSQLTFGDFKALLTGDLNEQHEEQILSLNPASLRSDLLKVPHHGSASGLLPAFLEAIQPKLAVISVGQNNPFGHPAASILKKLADRGIQVLRTDLHGRVEISSDGQSYTVKTKKVIQKAD